MIRFTISCSLLASLGVLRFVHGPSLELTMFAASVGAMVIMVHKGQLEDPTA